MIRGTARGAKMKPKLEPQNPYAICPYAHILGVPPEREIAGFAIFGAFEIS